MVVDNWPKRWCGGRFPAVGGHMFLSQFLKGDLTFELAEKSHM